jgi:hypothetical protein
MTLTLSVTLSKLLHTRRVLSVAAAFAGFDVVQKTDAATAGFELG